MNERRRHLIIPDTQVRPDVDTSHMDWIGRAIMDYRPDVIVHLGDHFDMPSLSSYASLKELEGKRIKADIEAGNAAMKRLLKPMHDYNRRRAQNKKSQYHPRMVFITGNHEERIERAIAKHPQLEGLFGYEDLELSDWEVIQYRQPIEIDGVLYCHYFYAQNSGRPYGGTTHSKLKNIGCSFTMGHQQGMDYAMRQLPNGKRQYGLVAGSCYLHSEDYRGPQANSEWRGVIIKNDVHDGCYDLMPLSLSYLARKYG
jgi:hypothetical protein